MSVRAAMRSTTVGDGVILRIDMFGESFCGECDHAMVDLSVPSADRLRAMVLGFRNGAALASFFVTWAFVLVISVDPVSSGDIHALLAGMVLTFVAVTVLVLVWRAEDVLFAFGRTTRGPTDEEHRRHGELRRQSHPDTAGRPRPRAPGPCAGTASALP